MRHHSHKNDRFLLQVKKIIVPLHRIKKHPAKDAVGQIPEWPNGADCKSAGFRLRWFESIFAHKNCGSSSVDRALAFQAEGRGFESRLPLFHLLKSILQRMPQGKYQSGQMGQTVNLLAFAFGGSNPSLPTKTAEVAQSIEH